MSEWEETLALHIRAARLPEPERQFRFHATRRWRADFAWPDYGVIAEVHGGIYVGGRHTRGKGFDNDRKKMNAAQLAGWKTYEFTPEHIKSGYAIALLEEELQ